MGPVGDQEVREDENRQLGHLSIKELWLEM